ncbi:MAG: hemerythrin domain-containing protein [Gammaproteobacteria bacterium]|jgi:hemerythrin-like domain-containing protein|nr:hemerythrin domain-containing protein [Gammaproteobacteria bacterium]
MRVNYYQTIHKALRRLLYLFSIELGCEDMGIEENAQKLQTQFLQLKALLEEHAHHEDKYLHPFISQKLPKESNEIVKEHAEQDKHMQAIADMFTSVLAQSDIKERQHLGYQLYVLFNRFVADYIAHLDQEEAVIMPLLWQCCDDDDELMKPLQAFLASKTKQDFIDSLDYMLPAMNPQERELMLSSL